MIFSCTIEVFSSDANMAFAKYNINLYVWNIMFVLLYLSHILDFMANIRRISISWRPYLEQLFQHFKNLLSTKIHEFHF